jgi:hypothetical protein
MNRFLMVILAASLLFSCGGSRRTPIADTPADSVDTVPQDTTEVDSLEMLVTDTPMPKAADELFDDFIFNFAANRNLQMERILFPLPVTRNGQTDSLDKKRWKTERFFLHQDYYTVLFDSERQMALMNDTSVNKATVEKIYFNTGAVIQYEFHRIRGAWMLTSVQTIPIAQNRNASFLDFYHQFVTDSVYQAESLHETVQFTGPDPDDDFAQMEGVITADTWPAFAPVLPEKMIYNIVYGEPSKSTGVIIFMMRGIANGFEMMMTFQQQNGRWVLTKMNT